MDKIYYQHMPVVEDQVKAGQTGFTSNWPMDYLCTPDIDLLDFPVMRHALNVAFAAMTAWVDNGRPPPRAARLALSLRDTAEGEFITDQHGNATGGLRNVYLDVPIATNQSSRPSMGATPLGSSLCGLP